MASLQGMVPLHSDISFQNTCDLHHKFGDFSFLLLTLVCFLNFYLFMFLVYLLFNFELILNFNFFFLSRIVFLCFCFSYC